MRFKGWIGAALVAACLCRCPFGDRARPSARVVNRTGEEVQVFQLRDGEEVLVNQFPDPESTLGSLGAGELGGSPCSRYTLIARREDGSPIERRRPPLCFDETWVIDGEPDTPT